MLVLDGVTKQFGTMRAVDSASLEIPRGQFVGVIGRSGAGKSTLLRMINRLSDPTAGRITWDGTDITRLNAPPGTALRDRALAHGAAIAARHRAVFSPPLAQRLLGPAIVALVLGLFAYSLLMLGFTFERVWNGLGRLGYILGYMLPPDPGKHFWKYFHALGETVAIALLGTLLGALLAVPLALLAAKNIIPNRLFHFGWRRGLDFFRAVDVLIWALIWINVVGLGPFAGILAIAMSDTGGFAKLFSEAIEAADRKPIEGVVAAGGGRSHGIRFGILPQIFPIMISQVLYYIESNTRSATIIGIVGAGGIGLHLSDTIRLNEWQNVSFLILMILVTVAIIDWISTRLRFAIIGRRGE